MKMRCYQPVGHLRDHTDVEERRIAVWLHKPMHHHLQRNIERIKSFKRYVWNDFLSFYELLYDYGGHLMVLI